MKRSILFVDQFSDLGGSQRGLLDLLPALGDYSVRFALPGPGAFPSELERRGIPWTPLSVGRYGLGHKSPADLLRYALRQPGLVMRLVTLARRADLLYANGPRVFPATAMAARLAGIPLLWDLNLEIESSRDRRLVEIAAAIGRPAIVACSRACLAPFPAQSYLRTAGIVVYGGVDAVAPSTPEAGPVIGMVGRVHPDKAQHDLLEAAPEILRSFPGARFRMVGPIADADYARRLQGTADMEIRDETLSPGEALAGLTVLAMPSRREAASRVVMEAFSAGIAVVASDAGGLPEVVGTCGLIFPRGSVSDLAASVILLLRDPELRQRMAAAGRERFNQCFRAERYRLEMLAEIEKQIASRPRSR